MGCIELSQGGYEMVKQKSRLVAVCKEGIRRDLGDDPLYSACYSEILALREKVSQLEAALMLAQSQAQHRVDLRKPATQQPEENQAKDLFKRKLSNTLLMCFNFTEKLSNFNEEAVIAKLSHVPRWWPVTPAIAACLEKLQTEYILRDQTLVFWVDIEPLAPTARSLIRELAVEMCDHRQGMTFSFTEQPIPRINETVRTQCNYSLSGDLEALKEQLTSRPYPSKVRTAMVKTIQDALLEFKKRSTGEAETVTERAEPESGKLEFLLP